MKWKQKLAIITALVHEPKWLDEPFVGNSARKAAHTKVYQGY